MARGGPFGELGPARFGSYRKHRRVASVYHGLASFDLAAVGNGLTRPLIAAAGRQNDHVRLLDRVANGGKRMPIRLLMQSR